MIRPLLAALTAAFFILSAPAFAHNGVVHLGSLDISAPFMRATLPNAPVGGGYFTITNNGTELDTLLSVTSSAAGDIQIHEMQMDGDVMKMRRLENGLDIPAGQTVAMGPGGYHLMLMDLKQPLVQGTTVTVTLTFAKAGSVDVQVPVLDPAAKGPAPVAMTMPMN